MLIFLLLLDNAGKRANRKLTASEDTRNNLMTGSYTLLRPHRWEYPFTPYLYSKSCEIS